MNFDMAFAMRIVPQVLHGIGTTILVAILSSVGAAAMGFTWEMLRRSGKPMRYAMGVFVDLIRSTPSLVQLYFAFFVLPFYGIVLPAMVVGVLGLSFYFSSYLAEVFKSGIDSIPRGQYEAAQSLHLSKLDTVRFVVTPQMLRNIAAPMGSYFVSILKSTPVLAVLAVPEMLGSALDIASDTYRYAEPMLVAGVLFLTLALVVTYLVKRLEVRLMASTRR
ncbi:ectoine/hydroxyectoine ABC transporter permease subunit EhuD [Paraburkholderia sabiae]|uniref:Ectoine/hydroxyectoine ABC transporter permease subunit EhuD n=1 Tax=Paraburkholderia sabiae TaxID=273251 RepID=A0ABU9QST5_9BURK|nr:ectoine/hydroxyectoine ABC transporter permease subunit EhuD [Paraburkholderia sabiae]WJZ79539.1 ectoine/hydroxyectoine ABC transporter permease subunit EhuD [Paraburkholderia sabiae]WJZ79547.1 ectoine/hydroxyectoine ABC transporter permease subunit EhuD [Paraburkholderia sabiae]CAD6563393.1 putative glutamine ABC transporter permease protein GlnP [Paraburkholderia sabiae]